MKTVTFTDKTIYHIDSRGIEYFNDGLICYIDFEQCKINYIEHTRRSNKYSEQEMKEITNKTVSVGERSWPYIDFFTEHITRFVFYPIPKPWYKFYINTYKQGRRNFIQFVTQLFKMGWSTRDLS